MTKKTPLFSIVIPTRNRAHLLPYAIRSALNQQFQDYEIVVVANNCSDNTREVVSAIKSDRIRYFETDKTLTMPENWEFAWTKAQGEYVTYLCDDDALSPSALKLLAEKTLHGTPPVISWEDAIYYYADWNDASLQNTLLLFYFGDTLVEDISTEVYKKELTEFNFAWSSPLPKLLNCAANRRFFEEWRKRLGQLFYPIAPDYSFAWISAHVCSDIRVLHRPLSIRGISDHSIGSNSGLGNASKEFFKEFGEFDFFNETQLDLPLSINHLAATFLRVNTALSKIGVQTQPLNKDAFNIALAKQLAECRSLLTDWDKHKTIFTAYVEQHSPQLAKTIHSLLQETPTIATTKAESMRDMHKRTGSMAAEYSGHLKKATKQHDGDTDCAACVLAFRKEILVEPEWSNLYLFGETVGAADPYGISTHVDYYYDLMTACRKKKRRATA